MPIGPGGLDSNGIWQFGEDDSEALASDLLNLGMGSVSTAISTLGGVLQVVSVSKTNAFSASVASGASVAVTDLSITHTLASSSNKLYVSAFFGMAAHSAGENDIAIALADDGTLVGIGDANGTSARITSGGRNAGAGFDYIAINPSFSFVYEPGDALSHTYTLHAINTDTATGTLYVNRTERAESTVAFPRSASSLTIMEVAG